MAQAILTAARVREALDYQPQTGAFYRKMRTAQAHQVGDRADFPAFGSLKGYMTVALDGRKWLAHRLAWLHVYGDWPVGPIDHLNRDSSDNRIENLRIATAQENAQNKRRARKDSQSGLMGAVWLAANKKFRARIQVDGKSIHVGMFATAEEAHAAYLAAKQKYHPGFIA